VPILALCALAWSQGFSINQSSRLFEINNATSIIYKNGCYSKAAKPKINGCDFGDLKSNKLIMLVGDSHAAQWFPGFERTSVARGFRMRVATKTGCPAILLDTEVSSKNSDCAIWEENILQYINISKPELVIVSNLTEYTDDSKYQMKLSDNLYIKSLIGFISKINPEIKVAVIGDTPFPRKDSVACLSLNWRDSTKCDLKNTKTAKTEMTNKVSNFRTTYFDSRLLLCNGKNCPTVINRKNVFRDGSHLSVSTIDIQTDLANQILDLLNSRGTF
jgi:hypothetical protein